MTDSIKQAMSALIDGEASEIEVHRVLRQFDSEPGLKASWVRFQQIRAVSRGESRLGTEIHLELHNRISAAIDAEEAFDLAPAPRRQRFGWQKPAAGFAVAATVAAVAYLGVFQTGAPTPGIVSPVGPTATAPIAVQPVSTGGHLAQLPAEFDEEPELRELDAEKQQRLREYLRKHDQLARKNPYSRTVNFPQDGGKN